MLLRRPALNAVRSTWWRCWISNHRFPGLRAAASRIGPPTPVAQLATKIAHLQKGATPVVARGDGCFVVDSGTAGITRTATYPARKWRLKGRSGLVGRDGAAGGRFNDRRIICSPNLTVGEVISENAYIAKN